MCDARYCRQIKSDMSYINISICLYLRTYIHENSSTDMLRRISVEWKVSAFENFLFQHIKNFEH